MDARRVVRILIVEDETTTGDYVAKGLREAAYTVEQVVNAAMREPRDGRGFDAIILDRNLPGSAAVRAAGVAGRFDRDSCPDPVCARTRGRARTRLRAGAQDYMTKRSRSTSCSCGCRACCSAARGPSRSRRSPAAIC
jgi:two-component system OmpR family response regulator